MGWEEGIACLTHFVDHEGHARVPRGFKTQEGFSLGRWVDRLRRNKDILSSDQICRLEALPSWSWDPLLDNWEEGFAYLLRYIDQEGHTSIPKRFNTEDGFDLGRWVSRQRTYYDRLTEEQIQRLEALQNWSWSQTVGNWVDDAWSEGFSYLVKYIEQEGHSKIPSDFKSEDGYPLGDWVGELRDNNYRLTPDKINKLEALPEWTWDPFADYWDKGILNLRQFVEKEGHVKVPSAFRTEDGFNLGMWVAFQTAIKDRLSPDQIQILESLPEWKWVSRTGRKTYGYIISPNEDQQGEYEMSLGEQERHIRAYAEWRNFKIEKIFRELHVPTSLDFNKRPVGKEILRIVRNKDSVICSTIDRIGDCEELKEKSIEVLGAYLLLMLKNFNPR